MRIRATCGARHTAASDRATVLVGRDPAWTEWLDAAGLNDPDAFVYLEVDDRDKPSKMLRGTDLTYKIGADRLLTAADHGRIVAEWLAIFGEVFDYWSQKKGTAPHPPLPDADASLPPEVEANLMAHRSDMVVDRAAAEVLGDDDDGGGGPG